MALFCVFRAIEAAGFRLVSSAFSRRERVAEHKQRERIRPVLRSARDTACADGRGIGDEHRKLDDLPISAHMYRMAFSGLHMMLSDKSCFHSDG